MLINQAHMLHWSRRKYITISNDIFLQLTTHEMVKEVIGMEIHFDVFHSQMG